MGIVSTIVCKTAGIAGMSAVVYDAYSVGRANLPEFLNRLLLTILSKSIPHAEL